MITNFQLAEHCHRLGIPLVGIFNKDNLPKQRVQGSYILNLQDDLDHNGNDQPGTHWTAFIIDGKQACYCDSFGFNAPAEVQHFLKPFRPYPWSHKQIQNPSSEICGYYVLYFLWWMNRHKHFKNMATRLEKFLNQFSEDYTKNKTLLEKYIKPL